MPITKNVHSILKLKFKWGERYLQKMLLGSAWALSDGFCLVKMKKQLKSVEVAKDSRKVNEWKADENSERRQDQMPLRNTLFYPPPSSNYNPRSKTRFDTIIKRSISYLCFFFFVNINWQTNDKSPFLFFSFSFFGQRYLDREEADLLVQEHYELFVTRTSTINF